MLDDVRRLLDADGLGEVPVLAVSARTAWASPSSARRSPSGSRPRSRPVPGSRPTWPRPAGSRRPAAPAHPDAVQRPGRRARGRPVRRGRRGADGGGRRRALDPDARRTGDRLARSPPGSPGSSPTRSSGCTSTSGGGQAAHRPGAHLRAEGDQVQRARVDSEVRMLADDVSTGLCPALGRGGPPRLGVAAPRPRRPARRGSPTPTSVPPGCRLGGLVRVLQWLLILPPSRRRLAGRARADGLPPGAAARTPGRRRSRCRRCCWSGAWRWGCCWPWCAVLVAATARRRARAADRRLREAVGRSPRSSSSSPWRRAPAYATVRTGLDRAALTRFALHRRPSRPGDSTGPTPAVAGPSVGGAQSRSRPPGSRQGDHP